MSVTARFRLQRPGFHLDAAFQAPGRGITALFGPSGCGKTSVLRCLAGLEPNVSGELQVAEACWQDSARAHFLAPHRRPVGYVFQEASLFTHLDVRANLEYGYRRLKPAQRRVAFAETVELLGVGPLLQRSVQRLSGGERQRVAMARALLASPSLLLMDEPLSALDEAGRAEILPYLERLHAQLAIPVFYVSHTLDEVMRLADHLLLMEAGRIAAAGPLGELLVRMDLPLARGEDAAVIIDTRVVEQDADFQLTHLGFPGGVIRVARQPLALDAQQRVRIHARDVSLSLQHHQDSSILNIFPARVLELRELDGCQTLVRLDIGIRKRTDLLARITRLSAHRLGVVPGLELFAQVKSVALQR